MKQLSAASAGTRVFSTPPQLPPLLLVYVAISFGLFPGYPLAAVYRLNIRWYKRNLGWIGRLQVSQGRTNESRRWCVDRLAGRNDVLDRFVVDEEEQLVLLDRTTEDCRPLIVVGKGREPLSESYDC